MTGTAIMIRLLQMAAPGLIDQEAPRPGGYRGGGWYDDAQFCRSAARSPALPCPGYPEASDGDLYPAVPSL